MMALSVHAFSSSSDTLKMAVFVVYPPPDTDRDCFQGSMSTVSDFIGRQLDDSFQLCFTGDLNFPHIDWKSEIVLSGQDTESRNSGGDLLRFLESNHGQSHQGA